MPTLKELVLLGHKDLQVHQDLLDLQVLLVQLEQREPPEPDLLLLVQLVQQDPLVQQAQLAPKGIVVLKV